MKMRSRRRALCGRILADVRRPVRFVRRRRQGYTVLIHPSNIDWYDALTRGGEPPDGVSLISGEIGEIEGRIMFVSSRVATAA